MTEPPETFNFAEHLFATNRGRAGKAAYVDDRGSAELRRARRALAPLRRGAARPRRAPRGARAAADARQQRLAGGLPRRLYAGIVPVAVNTLLTADDYAYMLRAQPRAGGARVGARCCRRSRRRWRAGAARGRARDRRRAPADAAAAPARIDFDALARRAAQPLAAAAPHARPTTRRSGSIRRARPAGPRARCTRTPIPTGPPSCTASAVLGLTETTSASPPPSCSSPTASATR